MQALERAFENNVLLRSCDEEQRGHIFDAMSEQTFTKGTVIIKQGDSGNFFYVIGKFMRRKIEDFGKILFLDFNFYNFSKSSNFHLQIREK